MLVGRAARNSGLMELGRPLSLCTLRSCCSLSCCANTSSRIGSGKAARNVGSIASWVNTDAVPPPPSPPAAAELDWPVSASDCPLATPVPSVCIGETSPVLSSLTLASIAIDCSWSVGPCWSESAGSANGSVLLALEDGSWSEEIRRGARVSEGLGDWVFVVAARVATVVVVGTLSDVELSLEEEVGTKWDTALTSSCARESAMDAVCTKPEALPEVVLPSEVCCKLVLTCEAMLAARTLTSTSAPLELSVVGPERVIDDTCGSVVETPAVVEDGGGGTETILVLAS